MLDGVLRKLQFRPVILMVQAVILLVGMVGLKALISKILRVEDDVSFHISHSFHMLQCFCCLFIVLVIKIDRTEHQKKLKTKRTQGIFRLEWRQSSFRLLPTQAPQTPHRASIDVSS